MQRIRSASVCRIGRQTIAMALSVLLVPLTSGSLDAQQPYPSTGYPQPAYAPPAYAPMDAFSLDQLVAPIALYPDSLVAQILTASTYPDQVNDAANWSRQSAGLPPDQRAGIANGMPWDPSVKALTAFPSVLDNLAQNYNWMSALGNAYYNQPGDVMNAIQAARYQAQQAGYLRSTPQQQVYYNNGQILIAPVNPTVIYVPYYNPWSIYAGWISPWPGYYLVPPPRQFAVGVGLGFFAGISVGLFAHYGWGWHAWQPDWRGGVVVYNRNVYISRSTTVHNRGHFGEWNHGAFERGGRGVPRNFRPPVTQDTARFGRGVNGSNRPDAVRPQPARPPATQERNRNQQNQVQRGQPQQTQPAPGRFERGPQQRGRAQQGQAQPAPAPRVESGSRQQQRGPQARPAPHEGRPAPHGQDRGNPQRGNQGNQNQGNQDGRR